MKKYIVKQRLESGEWVCVSPYFKKRRDAQLYRADIITIRQGVSFPVLRVVKEEEKYEKTV